MDLSSILRLRGVSPDQINMDMLPGGSGFGDIPQGPQLPAPQQAAGRDLAPADVALPPEKVGWGHKLGAMLLEGFGASPEVVRDVRHPDAPQRQAQAMMQRIAQAKRLFPQDEQAQMLWVTGDDDFRKSIAERYKPVKLNEGDESLPDARQAHKNTRTTVGVADGVGYTGDAERGITWGQQRQKIHAEDETTTHNRNTEALEAEKHADTEQDKADERDPTQHILRKAARGEALSPGEQTIFDAYIEHQKKGSGFDFGGGQPDAPPKPSGVTAGPRRAMPAAELQAALGPSTRSVTPGKAPAKFTEGQEVVQNGNVYSYRNGAFIYSRPAGR